MAYKGFNIDVRNYMEDCSSNPRDIILLFNDAYLVQMTQFLTLLGVWRHHSKASNYIRLVLPVWTMFIRLKGEPTNILLYKKLLRLKSIWIKSIIVFFLLFPTITLLMNLREVEVIDWHSFCRLQLPSLKQNSMIADHWSVWKQMFAINNVD